MDASVLILQYKGVVREYVVLVPGHPTACFLNLSEIDILRFQKNQKKIMHVDNHDLYLCTKNQPEMLCILGCVKKTNS
jgi:hypothetical protein